MIYYHKVYPFDIAIKEVFPLKYWRGYIVAALLGVMTWALTAFAAAHTTLIDMIYPYTTRLIQTSLAGWSSEASFCLWQLLAVLLIVAVLASIVAMLVLRWNFFQWLGWVLTGCMLLYTLHTGVYGLNYHAGPLSEDIRLEEADCTVTELAEATAYYLDMANELATLVPRNGDGSVNYPEFSVLAQAAAEGFETLTYENYYAVFSGSTIPVKELGWADMYTSMGILGVTMPLTGEAAVNPQTPKVALPFTMCHEMCHRMCIATERDANMGAFLACISHSDVAFQYSGYFMAFRYCYNALVSVGTTTALTAADGIRAGINDRLIKDLTDYSEFFAENIDDGAAGLATTVNDTYLKTSGDEEGVSSYSQVSDLLVSWYIQEVYMPQHQEEVITFDPTDKTQVDLTEQTE